MFHFFGVVPPFPMKLEDHIIIFCTYQLLVLNPKSSFLPSLSLVEYMTQIGKIEKDEDIRWIEFYDRKNTDLDFKLQIWLLFGLELIENKQMWKWWKWLKQETNIPNMTIIYWHEQNQQKQNKFWVITQNRPVMAR